MEVHINIKHKGIYCINTNLEIIKKFIRILRPFRTITNAICKFSEELIVLSMFGLMFHLNSESKENPFTNSRSGKDLYKSPFKLQSETSKNLILK